MPEKMKVNPDDIDVDDNNDTDNNNTDIDDAETTSLIENPSSVKTYRKRWYALFILSLNLFIDGANFFFLSGINNIASEYYSVSSVSVEWLTNMVTLGVIITSLPTSYLVSRFGIKPLLIAHALFIFIGAGIRCLVTTQYWLIMLSQILPAIGSAVALQTPGRVSAIWFPMRERATSTSIAVAALVFGGAVGVVFPPAIVGNHTDIIKTGHELFVLYLTQMITSLIILLITLTYDEKPLTPPCNQAAEEEVSCYGSLKLLCGNKYFLLLSQSYGIYGALMLVLPALINPIVTSKYKTGYEGVIGWMSFGGFIAGYLTLLVIGRLVDKYRKYRLVGVLMNLFSMITWTIFVTILLYTNNLVTTIGFYILVGVFFIPFWSTGIEQAAEITYPVHEHTSTGVLIFVANIYTFLLTFLLGLFIEKGYVQLVGYTISGLYLLASISSFFVKTELLRTRAELKYHEEN